MHAAYSATGYTKRTGDIAFSNIFGKNQFIEGVVSKSGDRYFV
ncbi:hypothetical protein [Burkholderia sp. SIMBA_062]